MNLNDEHLRILRHMLGVDLPEVKKPKPYRDYYCANRGNGVQRARRNVRSI